MKFLIIGLGIYGYNLAKDLAQLGHEVIGADQRPAIAESIKDCISAVYVIDSTDEAALSALPIKTVDIVIVAIGENFGSSIKTVALLKKLGVRHLYARAMDELHYSILEGFKVDRIITPEQRAARDLVYELSLGTNVESLAVDDDNYIVKFLVPSIFVGQKISFVDFRKEFDLRLVTISRRSVGTNALGLSHDEYHPLRPDPENIFLADDKIVCYGSSRAFKALFKRLS